MRTYEEKGACFQVIPPPPHQAGDGAISGPLALSSRSLRTTGVLHLGPAAAHPTLVPSPSAPIPPPQAAPILNFRGIDEDISAVPPPPPMIYVNRPASRGRSLTTQRNSKITMPAIPESPLTASAAAAAAAHEDSIPAKHKRIPEKIRTQNLEVPPLTPTSAGSDDGFTPVNTPHHGGSGGLASAFSPRLKTKIPSLPSPRDALGIPISKIKSFAARSVGRASPVDSDDLEPLSPAVVVHDADGLPVPVQQQAREKPKRRTVWGVLEGWWDLNLLDRGKSLRRK